MSVFGQRMTRYKEYLKEESKVRPMISESIPTHLRPRFPGQSKPHPRELLVKLKNSMSPDPENVRRKVEDENDRFIRRRWKQWPIRGPDAWIEEWVELMNRCYRWAPGRKDRWAAVLTEVWGSHLDLVHLVGWIKLLIRERRLFESAL